MLKRHRGGCHCGAVRFELEAPEDPVVQDCNCSICRKKGFLHLIVPPERFRLLSAPDAVALYEFNTKTAKHYFCSVCGIHSYYIPRSHPDMIDVNVRCLEGIDVGSLAIQPFNGQEWERERHTLDD